ncbi:MAG: elongator complex protein 3 [Deltaproteobacteria bacterium]
MNNYIIPIFVPHLGCPHDCIFCNQRRISGVQKEITAEDVKAIIEECLSTISKNNKIVVEAAFYGGSFTGIPKQKQEELLAAAFEYIKTGQVDSIRVSTRPDYINQDILKLLRNYGVETIELGVQSMDVEVLKMSCRGHSREDVIEASKLIKHNGFKLGHQMMIGLPGDTIQKDIQTAKDIIWLKPDIVRIYPTLVIKGTRLEDLYIKGLYTPLNIEEAVDISKELLKLFMKNDILVIRLGLQATENINLNKDILAGPFHSAFKELVDSKLRFDLISYIMNSIKTQYEKDVYIKVNTREISITSGHNKINQKKIKDYYGIEKIKVSGHNNIESGQIILRIGNVTVCMNQKFIQ